MKRYELLLAGIGGQGIITLSQIIADSAMESGVNLNLTQDRGLAQRGGTVRGQIRMGEVYSPLIPQKSLHTLLALEMEGTLNYVDLFNDSTTVFVSESEENPGFKDEILECLKPMAGNIYFIPAKSIARGQGVVKASNIYMLGVFFGKDERISSFIKEDSMINAIKKNVRHSLEKNIKLFQSGINAGKNL